jgi:rubrerythrin
MVEPILPVKLDEVRLSEIEQELLRAALIAELDAISLYEQLRATTGIQHVKEVFSSVIKEEKTHVGEFLALLNLVDVEQANELENGSQEIQE